MGRCGVLLPSFDAFRTGEPLPVMAAARQAEELGFASVWVGDHLACPAPNLDAVATAAAATAVTMRIRIGFSVLLLGLRPPAWTAKQLISLQLLSSGRLTLGVGVGGEFPDEFQAAGVPTTERGARVDEALQVLPDLLCGRRVSHRGRTLTLEVPALEPALAQPPPILIGGRGEAALRRAARCGDGWLPMWLTPERLRERRERLAELAAEQSRPAPGVTLLVGLHIDGDLSRARREADVYLRGQYGLSLSEVERWTPLGSIERVVGQLNAYRAVGVDEFVLMPLAREPLTQYERLAELIPELSSQ